MKKDEMKMKNWRQHNLTQRPALSLSTPLSLSLSQYLLRRLARCLFEVCLHVNCTDYHAALFFLSFLLPVPLSFFFSSAFASLLCSLLTHLICLHFVWHFALVISSSFLLTLPNANRLYFSTFFSASLSISLAVYCLPAILFPIVSPFSTFLTLDVFMYPPWVALGQGRGGYGAGSAPLNLTAFAAIQVEMRRHLLCVYKANRNL